MTLTRRGFLSTSGALSALALTACSGEDPEQDERDSLDDYAYDGPLGPETLFQHGVASGDPLPSAVILWTRVTASEQAVDVWWEIAVDTEFRRRVQVGSLTTSASRDFTVKIDVQGLEAGKTYYYRFKALGRTSPIGRTRTAPTGDVSRLRFGIVSCSAFAHGYFYAYRDLAEELDLDAIFHLGDYIYEYGSSNVRAYEPDHEIVTLDDYRTRYSQYRRDPDLQAIHRQHPFITVWDDHETANNSYKDGADNHDPETEGPWEARKAAAIQAYTEWLPIRDGEDGKIFRSFSYGNLADLIFLDTRLWGRDLPSDKLVGPAEEEAPGRSLLGEDQETWLEDQLKVSQANWKVVGQQVMMAHLKAKGAPNSEGGGSLVNHDQWQGYPGSQRRFLSLLEREHIHDVVVLTGDIHSGWANDLSLDPNEPMAYDPESGRGSLAVEFVTSSVTSPGFPVGLEQIVQAALTENPHIHYANVTQRGYVILDLNQERAQGAYYVYDDISQPSGATRSLDAVYATQRGANHLVREESPAPPKQAPKPAP